MFINQLPPDLFAHLTNLAYGVRLLLESSAPTNIRLSESLIDEFCSEILSAHAENEKVETINVHYLRHLTEQVKRFGPLYSYSAMSFESANRFLGEVCSGSSSEGEIICRRILQRHKLSGIDICNEHLQPLFSKLPGQ